MKSLFSSILAILAATTMLGATIVVTYGALQVEAAPVWCYEVIGGNKCVADPPDAKKSDCEQASQLDPQAVNPGKCFNIKKIS